MDENGRKRNLKAEATRWLIFFGVAIVLSVLLWLGLSLTGRKNPITSFGTLVSDSSVTIGIEGKAPESLDIRTEQGTAVEQALLGKDITTIKRGTGCTHCNGTGYRGRIAVHEIVTIDRNIRRMISRGAETEEIEAYAREQQGMRSLKEKGLELVKQGVTTPEELLRIAYYA